MVSASELRKNIHRLLDQVLESGVPLEIEQQGRRLRVVPADAPPKLARLVAHGDYVVDDAEELVHVDWSAGWRP